MIVMSIVSDISFFSIFTGMNCVSPTFGTHEIQPHIDNRLIDTILTSNCIYLLKEKISPKPAIRIPIICESDKLVHVYLIIHLLTS